MKKDIYIRNIIIGMLILLAAAIGASLLEGCSANHKLINLEKNHPELFVNSKKDSVGKTVTKYIKYDSIITVPGESQVIRIPSPCPPKMNFSHTATFKHGTATVNIQNDTLTVTCYEQAYKDTVAMKCKVIDSLHYIVSKLNEETKVKAPATTFQIVKSTWFWICIIGGIFYILFLYLKKKSLL